MVLGVVRLLPPEANYLNRPVRRRRRKSRATSMDAWTPAGPLLRMWSQRSLEARVARRPPPHWRAKPPAPRPPKKQQLLPRAPEPGRRGRPLAWQQKRKQAKQRIGGWSRMNLRSRGRGNRRPRRQVKPHATRSKPARRQLQTGGARRGGTWRTRAAHPSESSTREAMARRPRRPAFPPSLHGQHRAAADPLATQGRRSRQALPQAVSPTRPTPWRPVHRPHPGRVSSLARRRPTPTPAGQKPKTPNPSRRTSSRPAPAASLPSCRRRPGWNLVLPLAPTTERASRLSNARPQEMQVARRPHSPPRRPHRRPRPLPPPAPPPPRPAPWGGRRRTARSPTRRFRRWQWPQPRPPRRPTRPPWG
mmetsp:Transcript_1119/g.4322  ORF Transcript_1119/g.4322 Transcript_1119/m.4322 type:complete len:362 (-) Transcript_1119:1465-2550(-)